MKPAVFATKVIDFYSNLRFESQLPHGFSVMNPYEDPETLAVSSLFYRKYFNDTANRFFIFGINPGRLGGGITGIPFTDPLQLKESCGINHSFPLKKELSSLFIYKMIASYGGPEKFYSKFFLTAVCPLGFLEQNKNANYYDNNALIKATRPFILNTLKKQARLGSVKETCFCLGQGKNLEQLQELNAELKIFKKIIPLPHPRWIMQYRRKKADEYILQYIDAFINVHR